MIEGYSAVAQALMGTLFTWGVTALGAALVFLVPTNMSARRQQQILDLALGFSGGVMIAASFWSLLQPAFEFAEASEDGMFAGNAWVPVTIGFGLGGAFVFVAGKMLPEMDPTQLASVLDDASRDSVRGASSVSGELEAVAAADEAEARKRRAFERQRSWRRVLLLVIAITVHNFPEGLAVGVGFAAVGKGAEHATFSAARTLAIGIGLQNFPEGLAVSLPLMRAGYSRGRSFWYGQLSGMVEPLAGFLGAALVSIARPFLPYALAFAAGAMIYVVVDDLIPEAHVGRSSNSLCSWGVMLGFTIMMVMDTTL